MERPPALNKRALVEVRLYFGMDFSQNIFDIGFSYILSVISRVEIQHRKFFLHVQLKN